MRKRKDEKERDRKGVSRGKETKSLDTLKLMTPIHFESYYNINEVEQYGSIM